MNQKKSILIPILLIGVFWMKLEPLRGRTTTLFHGVHGSALTMVKVLLARIKACTEQARTEHASGRVSEAM